MIPEPQVLLTRINTTPRSAGCTEQGKDDDKGGGGGGGDEVDAGDGDGEAWRPLTVEEDTDVWVVDGMGMGGEEAAR